MTHHKSERLRHVCYEIRGPVHDMAEQLTAQGHRIMQLNIGNPAVFGLNAPDEILVDVVANLSSADGYTGSKGLFSARKAIFQDWQRRNITIDIDNIWLGNGVSELISISTAATLNPGDEVLIPSPDYPLWTAAVKMTGADPVHYRCEETNDWQPSIADIKSKITQNTRAIVVINPNNPTGAVYSRELLLEIIELAKIHGLIIYADEIYDRILFDGAQHIPMASLSTEVTILSFNGLSKSHRLAGFRAGWLVHTGPEDQAKGLIEGINMLCSMRLCSNTPAQLAIQTALGGHQSIDDLTAPGGRLYQQRQAATEALSKIEGVSLVAPSAAMYCFINVDPEVYALPDDDEQLVLDFLIEEHILIVQGSAFNLDSNHHFRFVFLPHQEDLRHAISRFEHFLARYKRAA